MNAMNAFPWSIFYILLAAGLLGTAAVIPYSLSLSSGALERLKEQENAGEATTAAKMPNLPKPVLILISALQNLVLISVAAFVGLLASGKVGLGTPILQAVVAGQPAGERVAEMLPLALLLGIACGAVMLLLEGVYFAPRIPSELSMMDSRTAFWKRILACFYGGIVEEILMRLFVMGGLAWLLGLIWQAPGGMPAVGAFWMANFLAALLFGAGHLPATVQITRRLTPTIVLRALLLNGIPGLAAGYLYMRYGLEAAMVLHFSLDIVIHLMATPLIKRAVQTAQPA
jgi:hypothetical protein